MGGGGRHKQYGIVFFMLPPSLLGFFDMPIPEIQLQTENRILTIKINRPEKKNALTRDMYLGLTEALNLLDSDDGIHVGLITGTPDCFTAGNDLEDFLKYPPTSEGSPVADFIERLITLKKPIIAAVNGPAIGIGTTLLLHCDFVYATNKTKFQLPFVNLGLCPEAASSAILPNIASHQKASELLMLGEVFLAEDALKMGIVNQIFNTDDYLENTLEIAGKLAEKPTDALYTTKALLKRNRGIDTLAITQQEFKEFCRLLVSPTAKEIMQAFIEKRKPDIHRA